MKRKRKHYKIKKTEFGESLYFHGKEIERGGFCCDGIAEGLSSILKFTASPVGLKKATVYIRIKEDKNE